MQACRKLTKHRRDSAARTSGLHVELLLPGSSLSRMHLFFRAIRQTVEPLIYVAMIRLMTRRLAAS